MRIKACLDKEEFKNLLQPKLKLFLSVDVVGSTSYKQAERGKSIPKWLNLFVGFFKEFPQLFDQSIDTVDERLGKVKLWKSLGDELIFTVELHNRNDAVSYLKAFTIALKQAAKNWHGDEKDPLRRGLHVKGAAWLVGFPVGNVEIPLETTQSDSRSDSFDYIGPAVDTGFRLKEHASPRKLVLSADLVYLVLSAGDNDIILFYEGEVLLKGILRGKPYPILWMDCDGHENNHSPENDSAKMNKLRDDFLNRKHVDLANLKRFLAMWFKGSQPCEGVPFIFNDPFADHRPPPDYQKRLKDVEIDLRATFDVAPNGDIPSNVTSEKMPLANKALLANVAKKVSRVKTSPTAKKRPRNAR